MLLFVYLFILLCDEVKKVVARARLRTTILPVVVDHGETAGTTQQAP